MLMVFPPFFPLQRPAPPPFIAPLPGIETAPPFEMGGWGRGSVERLSCGALETRPAADAAPALSRGAEEAETRFIVEKERTKRGRQPGGKGPREEENGSKTEGRGRREDSRRHRGRQEKGKQGERERGRQERLRRQERMVTYTVKWWVEEGLQMRRREGKLAAKERKEKRRQGETPEVL